MRRNKETAQFVFLIVIGLLFLWIALESRTFPRLSRTYPQTLAIVMLVATVAELGRMWWNQRRKAAEEGGMRETAGSPGAVAAGSGSDAALEAAGAVSDAGGSGGAAVEFVWSELDFATRLKAVAPYILWILGYFGLIYLIGFLPGSFVFAFVSATWIGKLPWVRSLLTTAVVIGALYYLGKMLSLRWPGALLF